MTTDPTHRPRAPQVTPPAPPAPPRAAESELTRLRADVARLTQERDGWQRTAIEMATNADFYRGIVHQSGAHFGVAAYTSDDGSVQDEVLALKVPELAEQAVAERDALRAVLVDVRAVVAELVAVDRRRLSRVVADIDAALGDMKWFCADHEPAPPDQPREDEA